MPVEDGIDMTIWTLDISILSDWLKRGQESRSTMAQKWTLPPLLQLNHATAISVATASPASSAVELVVNL
eukprot:SAG31_NODE_13338_length_876_cov_0.872587_1_plen_69_part_01